MSERGGDRKTALMVAYTNYQTDPRVVRAAQAAVEAGFEVDFIALRKDGEEDEQYINGVRVIRLAQTRYRGGACRSICNRLSDIFLQMSRTHHSPTYPAPL